MDKRSSQLYDLTERQRYSFPTVSSRDTGETKAVLRMTSQQLFAGAHELEIMHQGAQYRLRQTALGKLILTK
jgi:hemin uptake protein HemP